MDELTVIGVENGALVVVSAEGTRFRVPITEALHTALRQNRPAAAAPHRVGPRKVQSMIRQGLTAGDVAAQTGEPLEYIQRFEGPVLAEREYVITAARSVPVAVAAESESGRSTTFGSVIDHRLDDCGAQDVRWESHKTDAHWMVSVGFLDNDVARTAVWSFDPKKSLLAPANHEAQSLSQQHDATAALLPRLRAVPDDVPTIGRFDSGAFAATELPHTGQPFERPERPVARMSADSGTTNEVGQTADLLEALRRRRGQREPAPHNDWESSRAAHPSTGSIRIVEIPLDGVHGVDGVDGVDGVHGVDEDDAETDHAAGTTHQPGDTGSTKHVTRRGRASMPTWDEIVFGARPEDEPS